MAIVEHNAALLLVSIAPLVVEYIILLVMMSIAQLVLECMALFVLGHGTLLIGSVVESIALLAVAGESEEARTGHSECGGTTEGVRSALTCRGLYEQYVASADGQSGPW